MIGNSTNLPITGHLVALALFQISGQILARTGSHHSALFDMG
jgi:hypothetical protein